jgi:type I site-specific restriction endonuclease
MDGVDQVSAGIQKISEQASLCGQAETSDNYGALADQIEEVEASAREVFESELDIASLLRKLKEAKPLSAADLKTLELLIVGDAEYYLKYETELEHWKNEIKEVLAEIAKLQSSNFDVDNLMHLRALCREAARVLPAIVFYFDQKERAAKFQAATKDPLDADAYRFLAQIVEEMLVSDKM